MRLAWFGPVKQLCIAVVGLALASGLARGDDAPKTAAQPVGGVAPATPASPALLNVDPLARQIDEAIQINGRRFLDVDVQTPWQIAHGLLAYRRDFMVKKNGEKVNALEWVAGGPIYRDQPWFEKTPYGGRGHRYNGTPKDFEGHPNQFMAYMTMCDLPLDYTFKTGTGETITISDLIKNAQMEVNGFEEVTWTLWFLSHYLEPDAQWLNKSNEPWSIERMVQIENGKQVTSGACGGTHGLFALAYARNSHRSSGRPLNGVWFEADQKVQRYVQEAIANQNPDGTFSANFFQGPGYSQEVEKRLGTTGHILEFLLVALPQQRLSEPWIRSAAAALADDMIKNRKSLVECGALYHAVDALVIYRARVWPELAVQPQVVTAKKPAAAETKPAEANAETAKTVLPGTTP